MSGLAPSAPAPAPAPPPASPAARRSWLLLLLLCAWTAGTYRGVAAAGRVWDDHGLRLPGAVGLAELLGGDLWAHAPGAPVDSGYFRPVFVLGLAFDQVLLGGSLPAAHLHSLAWHLAAVVLVVRLLGGLLPPMAALAAGALFALHPAQSEAVAWLAARNDPMATALGLAALVCVQPVDAGRVRLVGGALLAALALLAKESVLVLPALLVLLDLAAGRGAGLRRPLALALGLGLALGLRALVGVSAARPPDPAGLELLLRDPLALPGALGASLSVAWPLAATRSLEWLAWEPPWRRAAGLVTLVLLAAVPLLLPGSRRRLALAGAAWLALGVVPALLPIVDKGLVGERYLYLGVVGLGMWAAAVAGRALPVAVLVLALPWHLLVQDRVRDWRDDDRFWLAAWQDTGTPYAAAGLGLRLGQAGRPDLALPLLVGALDQDPPARDACGGLLDVAVALQGAAAEPLGRWAMARGCAADHRHASTLAAMQAQLGQWERAARTLALSGPDPRGRDLAVRVALLRREGRQAEAEALLAGADRPEEVARKADLLLGSAPPSAPADKALPPLEP